VPAAHSGLMDDEETIEASRLMEVMAGDEKSGSVA
jgi:hypothetical protein